MAVQAHLRHAGRAGRHVLFLQRHDVPRRHEWHGTRGRSRGDGPDRRRCRAWLSHRARPGRSREPDRVGLQHLAARWPAGPDGGGARYRRRDRGRNGCAAHPRRTRRPLFARPDRRCRRCRGGRDARGAGPPPRGRRRQAGQGHRRLLRRIRGRLRPRCATRRRRDGDVSGPRRQDRRSVGRDPRGPGA